MGCGLPKQKCLVLRKVPKRPHVVCQDRDHSRGVGEEDLCLGSQITRITRDDRKFILQFGLLAWGCKSVSVECCFSSFRQQILQPQAQHVQVRTTSDQARGRTKDSDQKALVLTLLLFHQQHLRSPAMCSCWGIQQVTRTGTAPVLRELAIQLRKHIWSS